MLESGTPGIVILQANKLALPVADGYEMVTIADIIRCEADINYSNIHCIHGKKTMITRTLKEMERALSCYGFLRIHKHHLVNMFHVTKYCKGKGGYLTLTGGAVVEVSHRCRKKLMETLSW